MSEQQIDKNTSLKQEKTLNDEMEIDLMDILRKIISIRKTLYKAAGVGLVIGLIVALSIPKQYTVKVTLSPEIGGNKSGNEISNLAASFLGNTISSGDGVGALNVSLSSYIVSSTPFLMELLTMEVQNSDNRVRTLGNYLEEQSSPWWNYVIGLPSMLIGKIKSLFTDEMDRGSRKVKQKVTVIELSPAENGKINLLRNCVKATTDSKLAITSVSVTLQNPKIAAIVADSVVHKLQEYIINYRISKAVEDCSFLEKLFEERKREYYVIQKKYAEYVDTHDNVILQGVRIEQERLLNDMNLAYQVYSQVANQLQVAKAKVQEEKPVFAVVEPVVVPLYPSSIGFKTYVLIFVFLFIVCTVCWIFIGNYFWNNLRKKNRGE